MSGTLRPDVAASVLRAAADAGVRPDVSEFPCSEEFAALWEAAKIGKSDDAVDDTVLVARERLKAHMGAHGLTGGWLGSLVFDEPITLIQPHTVLRDAPKRKRK